MEDEIWYSKTFDDLIRLRQAGNFWKGVGDRFEFIRETKTAAIMLLLSWDYEPANDFLPGQNKQKKR